MNEETLEDGIVKVVFSSEYKPRDKGWWYCDGQWEDDITYKLNQQPDLKITDYDTSNEKVINVIPTLQYQSILGIGTSLEESTVCNISKMSEDKKDYILKQLFTNDNDGIDMNYVRLCIGTSDFTGRKFYTYDDMPEGETDPELLHFSIQKDIENNIIKIAGQAKKLNKGLKFFASPWSPPSWMKTHDSLMGEVNGSGNYIDSDKENIYVKYLLEFLKEYYCKDIKFDAMTIQNEPLYPTPDYPGCLMTAENQISLVQKLRYELDLNGFKDIKLWVYDHNFDKYDYVDKILQNIGARAATEGVAWHGYSGEPTAMTYIKNKYDEKSMYITERSLWGVDGAATIIEYFRNWAKSYIMWVTMLDSNIEPEQWSGVPDTTMLIQSATEPNKYWRTPEFYIMGQFSRYIETGAVRIYSDLGMPGEITNVAFLNPDNTIVLIAANQHSEIRNFRIRAQGKQINASIPGRTVATFKWRYESI